MSKRTRNRAAFVTTVFLLGTLLVQGTQGGAASAQSEEPTAEAPVEVTVIPTETPLPPIEDLRGGSEDPDDQPKRVTNRLYLPVLSQETPVQPLPEGSVPALSQHTDDHHDGHSHEDADKEFLTPEDEARIYDAIKANNFGNPNFDQTRAQAVNAVNNATNGVWEGPYDWPLVAVHAVLMPNGKVMAYDSIGDRPTEAYVDHNTTRAVVYDPDSNSSTRVDVNTGYNLFCSGASLLADGRVYLAGGNKDQFLNGIEKTHTFNTWNNQWAAEGNMLGERWYPSVTTLATATCL
jgi:hypothetical protein